MDIEMKGYQITMKKILSTTLAVLILTGAFAISVPAIEYSTRLPFNDTENDSWYAEYVKYMYSEDLMFGTGQGRFEPQSGMTRAELATLLSRMMKADTSGYAENAKRFSDINGTEWYADYVGWAAEEEILIGYPDGTVRPNDNILRQEIATVICRFADKFGIVLMSNTQGMDFKDAHRISSYAVPFVNRLVMSGIIVGYDNGEFRPQKSVTRAETSKIIMILNELIKTAKAGEIPDLSYDRETSEDYKVWGALHLYWGGVELYSNMTTELDTSASLPMLGFEDIYCATREGQQAYYRPNTNNAKAPWYIGVNYLAMDVNTLEYPVFSMVFKGDVPTDMELYIKNDRFNKSFTVSVTDLGDGMKQITADTAELLGSESMRINEDFTGYIYIYPFGDDEKTDNFSVQYVGFFKNEADALSFDPMSVSDYMNTYIPKYSLDWREYTSSVKNKYEDSMNERIKEIKSSESIDPASITGTCYYISSINGDDANDGLSPETPWASMTNLYRVASGGTVILNNVKEGDGVFFERGSVFNSSEKGCVFNYGETDSPEYNLTAVPGVTYSAYGEGEKPLFTRAIKTGSGTGTWEKTEYKNIWMIDVSSSGDGYKDIGNIVLKRGDTEGWGIKVIPANPLNPYDEGALTVFCDMVTNGFGDVFSSGGTTFENVGCLNNNLEYFSDFTRGKLYMYYDGGNPADAFDEIILCGYESPIGISKNEIDTPTVIDNLCIKYGGSHGIRGGYRFTVQNCEIGWIGGALQETTGSTTRYGNAIENWGGCDGFSVVNCYSYQIYDTHFTTQSATPDSMKNVEIAGNVLTYSNSPFEIFGGSEYVNIHVHDNYMAYSGYHFGHQRVRKNASFISGVKWNSENCVFEDNVMLYSSIIAYWESAFASDRFEDGFMMKNNVFALNTELDYFYYGYENTGVKQSSMYGYMFPYTERFLQYLVNFGIEKGSTFYYYDKVLLEEENERVYRFTFEN